MADFPLLFLYKMPLRWLLLAGLLVLGLLAPQAGRAQILDDSTRNRYGARTTFVLKERDLLRGDTVGRVVDSTLTRLPQQRYWTHDTTFQQTLGYFGSASRPLLWEASRQLGGRLGRTVFDQYARRPEDVNYYDTRSPYTFFRFFQGNPYEQVFELGYARSLGKRFNVGFNYERLGANKALAVSNTKTGQVEHNNFVFFARYQSLNNRYRAMGHFATARHTLAEQGGIRPLASDTLNDGRPGAKVDLSRLFDYQREVVNLTNAKNRDSRDRARLLHSYQLLGRGLTAYHLFDWSRQLNRYTDEQPAPGGVRNPFYPINRLSSAATDDRAEFRQLENTVGVMGQTPRVSYRLYGRYRTYSLVTRSAYGAPPVVREALPTVDGPSQLFAGGTAAFQYRQFAIETSGEFKPSANVLSGSEYRVSGLARLGFLSGELLLTSAAPTLTEQQFSGNHFVWNTDFKNVNVQQLRVRAARQLGRHFVEAVGTGANVSNYIYYSVDPLSQTDQVHMDGPRQTVDSSHFQIGSLMGRYRGSVGKLFFETQATFTAGASSDNPALRIPAVVGEVRVYYQGYLFKKALFGQVGVQGYYQSRWQAYDYSPSTQQFFVQDHFTIRSVPVADVFLNADIKTVGVFLKMAYVNQFLSHNGYFAAPYYPALPRRLQFGLRWQFFN